MPMPRSSSIRGREERESLSICLTSIPSRAFHQRNKLDKDKVEFCEGLMEIGEESFGWCYHPLLLRFGVIISNQQSSITTINLATKISSVSVQSEQKSLILKPNTLS